MNSTCEHVYVISPKYNIVCTHCGNTQWYALNTDVHIHIYERDGDGYMTCVVLGGQCRHRREDPSAKK